MTAYTISSGLMARLLRAMGDRIASQDMAQRRICIVNYHRVLESEDPLLESEPDIRIFRWQMKTLADCFNVLSLPDALQALNGGTIPPRAVCITFDDGYASVHDLALGVLKEFNLPATVFVTSGYMDNENMWNDRIINAVRHLPGSRLDLRDVGLGVYNLDNIGSRKLTIGRVTEDAKYLAPQARQDLTQRLENMAGGGPQPGLMLTREMVRTLAQQGIEIGAHTVSHPILTSLDDVDARDEIVKGKQQLEDVIGKPVRFFAYPNGKAGMDFDERHVKMAREAGFDAAFTTAIGAFTQQHDRYQIPRSRPWDATPFLFGIRLLRWLAR